MEQYTYLNRIPGQTSVAIDPNMTLSEKIELGMRLAYKRLVLREQKEDGVLIQMVNGKVTEVRARDIDVSNL